eukprot:CAMPEP_0171106286 /NCGR_PEP_ID=MMETSP0766_2-20121228/64441_1 /TAXON_ID=439317 /ORGANISM="Gambierdiscus australes, Strain CAWD 149" /LENGTH=159 /DNA_ID=CAMNT_0011567345 /DNA_START=79 /DNA_END=558 /DNA_ORIENTATION=+
MESRARKLCGAVAMALCTGSLLFQGGRCFWKHFSFTVAETSCTTVSVQGPFYRGKNWWCDYEVLTPMTGSTVWEVTAYVNSSHWMSKTCPDSVEPCFAYTRAAGGPVVEVSEDDAEITVVCWVFLALGLCCILCLVSSLRNLVVSEEPAEETESLTESE